MRLTEWLNDFLFLFYPELCVICQRPLIRDESHFCLECFLKLPKTNYCPHSNNQAAERFAGKIPLEKATSCLYYNKGGVGQTVVAEIKYKGNRKLGEWMGVYMARELLPTGFMQGVDYLVPVPLHKAKEKKRGFNQSEKIAEGFARIARIPLEAKNVYRKKANETQTKKGIYERWKNTEDLFELKDTELFTGKHVLIIDDVLTTGSTLEAVARCILKSPGAKVSILTLAIT